MVEVTNRCGIVVKKPSTILEYNDAKAYIDLSDQLSSYATTLRKSLKWYRKVAIELLTNTTIVNAFEACNILNGYSKKTGIVEFREKLALHLLFESAPQPLTPTPPSKKHELRDIAERKRGRCTLCCLHLVGRVGSASARKQSKQVYTNCIGCTEYPFMCLSCFFCATRLYCQKVTNS